jgi:cytoskeletal protein RodZ
MSIEGLGKRFQEARAARGLTLDEAARLTKIRQSRLAEIEADDFSNFPSLAYAKGFLQIYGKFLHVDVTPYMDAFETSDQITVDGYSYLQDNPAPRPTRTAAVPRDAPRTSIMPLVVGLIVFFVGFWLIKLMLNVQRITPRQATNQATATATPTPGVTVAPLTTLAPRAQPVDTPARVATTAAPANTAEAGPPTVAPTAIAVATPVLTPAAQPPSGPPTQPEVRRAQPVRPEEIAAAAAAANDEVGALGGPYRVDIKPLRKTYLQVTVDDDPNRPAFERWVSPSDGIVEFRGHRFSVRVLDREAVQIRKNGKIVYNSDADLRIE